MKAYDLASILMKLDGNPDVYMPLYREAPMTLDATNEIHVLPILDHGVIGALIVPGEGPWTGTDWKNTATGDGGQVTADGAPGGRQAAADGALPGPLQTTPVFGAREHESPGSGVRRGKGKSEVRCPESGGVTTPDSGLRTPDS